MILKIFGYKNLGAQDYAVKLGVAMQLTNILRDIKEDYARGRIYLPQNEMLRFGVTENTISRGIADDCFRTFMKFQIKRTRRLYLSCEPGIKMITDKRCRFVAFVMKELYAGILDKIETNHYDVFSRRAYVGLLGKLIRTFKALRKT